MTNEPLDLQSLSDAVVYTGLSKYTFRQLIERGEVDSARIGGKLYVPRAALDALINRATS